MTNEKMFKVIKRNLMIQAKTDLAKARSWQKVGKNYATRKDGKPFSDPAKSLQGVDGIAEIYIYTRQKKKVIKNSAGFSLDITGLTLNEVEESIKTEISKAKRDYIYRKYLLLHLSEICKLCDDFVKTFLSAYGTEIGKTIGGNFVWDLDDYFVDSVAKNYLLHMFLPLDRKKRQGNSEKQ